MKAILLGVIVGMALHAVPSPATAQSRACADDVQKFCADVKGGGGRFLKCLKAHEADLSAACKAQMQTLKSQRGKRWQACRSDVGKFCKDTRGGARMRCLQAHQSELSPDCKSQIQLRPRKPTP